MNRITRWAATLGISALFVGIVTLAPASAQNYWRGDRDDYRQDNHAQRHIRRDINDIRGDEYRLQRLEEQRGEEAWEHDRGQVRRLDREIRDLRRHIDRDRRDVHRDIRNYRRDRDYNNDSYRYRDYGNHYRYDDGD